MLPTLKKDAGKGSDLLWNPIAAARYSGFFSNSQLLTSSLCPVVSRLPWYVGWSIRKIQRTLEEIGFFQNIGRNGRNIFLPGRKKPDFSMEETAPRKKLPTLPNYELLPDPSTLPAAISSSSSSASSTAQATSSTSSPTATTVTAAPPPEPAAKSDPEVEKILLVTLCDVGLTLPIDSITLINSVSKTLDRDVPFTVVEDLLQKFAAQTLIR